MLLVVFSYNDQSLAQLHEKQLWTASTSSVMYSDTMTARLYLTGGQLYLPWGEVRSSRHTHSKRHFQKLHNSNKLMCCTVIVYSVSSASFMSPGELCANPAAVISDNNITPEEEFDLASLWTQIHGQKRRVGWGGYIWCVCIAGADLWVITAERTIKSCWPCQVYAQDHLLWIKI